MVQYNVRNNQITDNVFTTSGQNIFITNPYKTSSDNLVDHNIYISPDKNRDNWQWNGRFYDNFQAYKRGTGNDANSSLR